MKNKNIKSIVSAIGRNMREITEYFDYNRISYAKLELWNSDLDLYMLDDPSLAEENTLLIINHIIFIDICSNEMSLNQLIKFCKNNNKLWIWGDIDGVKDASENQNLLMKLDILVPTDSILLFFDGQLVSNHPLIKLCNIKHVEFPYSRCLHYPRITKGIVDKNNCSKDFLLTTVRRPQRIHRDLLWNQFTEIPGLIDRGYVSFDDSNGRIGIQTFQYDWSDGHPSMDLYLDSWLEVVPETAHENILFVTEKTMKPIATKTPFLTVAIQNYHAYLKKHGFKTFDSIIDERYDQHPQINDRIRLMLIQLQDIIENGSESFYNECKPILEHNQNRLLEIHGRKMYETDIFIATQLNQIGIN